MTRINAGIPSINLTDQHLLSEHREITRLIPLFHNRVKKGGAVFVLKGNPKTFSLGSGHVTFFLNKLHYIKHRYDELFNECKNRGFEVTDKRENFEFLETDLISNLTQRKDYKPNETERELLIHRICERIVESKQKPRYYGKNISKEDAIKILKS